MSTQIKNIVTISASPKTGESSVSELLASMAARSFADGASVTNIVVRRSMPSGRDEESFKAMLDADAIVFTFPLYFFCLPGILMRFLQDYTAYRAQHAASARSPKVYAIVNCGFPEPELTREAVRVIRSFCAHTDAQFRFGIMLGGGGMLLGAKDAPFMKKFMEKLSAALCAMTEDIEGCGKPPEDVTISVNFPRKFYFFMGNMGWKQMAKKNGLKSRDLYAKPYR